MTQYEFDPNIYVDITQFMAPWNNMFQCYEHLQTRANNVSFIDYSKALAKMRGMESSFDYACAFDICPHWKIQINDLIP